MPSATSSSTRHAARLPTRCAWAGDDPLMRAYHDTEWGVPEYEDGRLFEKLLLDGFQAGLSWRTILHRRAGMRQAFAHFEARQLAAFTPQQVAELQRDPRVIRNAQKIRAAISNATAFLRLCREPGDFSRFLWQFVDHRPAQGRGDGAPPPLTPASVAMSKALRAQGFSFCGPTICYAFMQAVGMVNDHADDCICRPAVAEWGRAYAPPPPHSSIGLISDTHGLLRPAAIDKLRGSGLILHAGDVGSPDVLMALRRLAPVVAVRGNVDVGDWARQLPYAATVPLGPCRAYLTHRQADLPAALPADVGLVLVGHSHKPGWTLRDQVLHINPGSAGPRRFRLPITVGQLRIEAGRLTGELHELSATA